jgi:4,5-dihydroxyphthalate decarboxylase
MDRREAVKIIVASTMGATSYGLASGTRSLAYEEDSSVAGKLKLMFAGYEYDRVAPLTEGQIPVEGCELDFEADKIGQLNSHVFAGPQTRDFTEIGLHPFMLAYANDNFRDYTLLPVFPLRAFRHKSIFIRSDRGITTPSDLRGKKIATPGYSSSSLTWIRGILQHEYGVAPTDVEWIVSAADSSSKVTGGASRFENIIPEGLQVARGPEGKDESEMLADGDVDALFHAVEPRCYVEGHPQVNRLFSDFRSVERNYFSKTGIFPIMHAVAMRKQLIEAQPWLPAALFKAYSEAKRVAFRELKTMGWANISLPWIAQEIEETRSLMGENFWPYGIEANRKSLEALFEYSYEQGLANKRLEIEELFHPSTLELEE